jgi:hypothetical protein
MKKVILTILILSIFSYIWADEIVTLKNGKKIVLMEG